jgi:hypothetical protein
MNVLSYNSYSVNSKNYYKLSIGGYNKELCKTCKCYSLLVGMKWHCRELLFQVMQIVTDFILGKENPGCLHPAL